MSEWGYIGLAYGITWTVLIGYAIRLARHRSAAVAAWHRESAHRGEA